MCLLIKTLRIVIYSAILLILSVGTSHSVQPDVVHGPITNPANGHVYYLLDRSIWTDAEAKAVSLGGHLATINDAAEDNFVYDTFTPIAKSLSGLVNPGLWIGFNDVDDEGSFVWVSSQPVTYVNWGQDEPNNLGNEDYVHIITAGLKDRHWGDSNVDRSGTLAFAVAEVEPIIVPIDIEPGNRKNRVNPCSKGRLKVAVLTTDDFDASIVDTSTVQFGPCAAEPKRYRLKDVDDDGDQDLVLSFETKAAGISCCANEASLTGQTFLGDLITGTDFITPRKCKKK